MVRKHGLRKGDAITGATKQPREGDRREKFNPLVRIDTVNGGDLESVEDRPAPVVAHDHLRQQPLRHWIIADEAHQGHCRPPAAQAHCLLQLCVGNAAPRWPPCQSFTPVSSILMRRTDRCSPLAVSKKLFHCNVATVWARGRKKRDPHEIPGAGIRSRFWDHP